MKHTTSTTGALFVAAVAACTVGIVGGLSAQEPARPPVPQVKQGGTTSSPRAVQQPQPGTMQQQQPGTMQQQPGAVRPPEQEPGTMRMPPQKPDQGAARSPLEQLGTVLDGLHVRDGKPGEQMEVIHYCGMVSADMHQCALFDGNAENAKLVGVEYVITAQALQRLPNAERRLWHQHAYEVKSGQLAPLGLSPEEELALVAALANTYGKTWHTWQHDKGDQIPLGRPTLMMAFTKDGQVKPELVRTRDANLGISTEQLRQNRADIANPTIVSGVDRGEGGRSCGGAPRTTAMTPQP